MLQVKIFKSLEFHYDDLTNEVNKWIADNRIDVVDIRVQIAPQSPGEGASLASDTESDVLCYVVYRV